MHLCSEKNRNLEKIFTDEEELFFVFQITRKMRKSIQIHTYASDIINFSTFSGGESDTDKTQVKQFMYRKAN